MPIILRAMRWCFGCHATISFYTKTKKPCSLSNGSDRRDKGTPLIDGATGLSRLDGSGDLPGPTGNQTEWDAVELTEQSQRQQRVSSSRLNSGSATVSSLKYLSKSQWRLIAENSFLRTCPSSSAGDGCVRDTSYGVPSSILSNDEMRKGVEACLPTSQLNEGGSQRAVNADDTALSTGRVSFNTSSDCNVNGEGWMTSINGLSGDFTEEEYLLAVELHDYILERGVLVDHRMVLGAATMSLALLLLRQQKHDIMRKTGPDELVALTSAHLGLSTHVTADLLRHLVGQNATAARLATDCLPCASSPPRPEGIWVGMEGVKNECALENTTGIPEVSAVRATVVSTLSEACRLWSDTTDAMKWIAKRELCGRAHDKARGPELMGTTQGYGGWLRTTPCCFLSSPKGVCGSPGGDSLPPDVSAGRGSSEALREPHPVRYGTCCVCQLDTLQRLTFKLQIFVHS